MSKQSMGDLFLQQRRERATSSAPSSNLTLLSSGNSSPARGNNPGGAASNDSRGKTKSFAEIQQEQLNEKVLPKRPDVPPRGHPRNNNSRTRRTSDTGPIEQGVIHTLLDNFGFIHCADRPIELFFHYTSTNLHWDDLNIGDEVEFRVGTSGRRGEEDKLKAFDVRILQPNTIVWETEDEIGKIWRGSVDKVPREREREKIRGVICVDNEDIEATFSNVDSKARLGKGDIVEFSLFTERRTGAKLAKNIVLIQSERERVREEKEAKLLENAALERGIVVSDKGDFGFIKSVNRVVEVYFHISHLLIEEDGKDMLKEGQEVEFYVIDESSLGDGARRKSGKSLCARKIKILPKGSVKFEHILAEGVTGVVLECPVEQRSEGFSRSGGGDKKRTVFGRIRLDEPVKAGESDDIVTEIILHPDLYPGGTYAMNRVGSEMGSWLRPGDTLLFDVVQTISDGKIKAIPTKYTQIASLRTEGWAPDDSTKPAVRLIELSLAGRTEGVIRSIREDYAFIHCAERNVDAYMKLYEVFPNELYSDLVLNNPDKTEEDNLTRKGGRAQVEVGMNVSFDLSLQALTNHIGGMGGRGRNNRTSQEKENLRARRVQILPNGTVIEKIPFANKVKATIIKDHNRQQFAGTLELEESITVQTTNQRYPYITKLLDYVSLGKYGDELMFHDIISEKDAQAVTLMVNARDNLEWRYVPLEGESVEDTYHRKLCITRRSEDTGIKKEPGSSDIALEELTYTGKDQTEVPKSEDMKEVEELIEDNPAKETSCDFGENKSKRARVIKRLRYDKVSFPDLSIGSLGVGDIITCDLYLSRSSGQVHVENIAVIERKERPVEDVSDGTKTSDEKKNLTGYVTEVVSSRQFGFITGIDENGSKTGDHVFFHFKTINSTDNSPQDPNSTKTKKFSKCDAIRKGDEVKFDAEPGKNGKLTATDITILPRGTLNLPNKVDKSTACTGYILLEPSHTSLANTPSHMVMHSGPSLDGVGRWDNVGKEPKATNVSGSNIKEEGVILLLTDPSDLFSLKPPSEGNTNIGESGSKMIQNEDSDNYKTDEQSDPTTTAIESAIGTHVRYKTSSLAYRFSSDNPDRSDGPRRGDRVVFGKTKGARIVKDIRIETLEAATTVEGILEDINVERNTAFFISSDGTKYAISLSEVVSCEKSLLQEKQEVNGILHNGMIFGVCRTKDIFLSSSLSKNSTDGPRQRPKLNLTVKKELQGMGGQIMAQSKMAKGPDGTNGFVPGWSRRLSPNVKTFIPACVADSEFDLSHSNAADE